MTTNAHLPLLEVRSLSVSYARGSAKGLVLKRINLVLHDHEILSIVGKSGVGKTTLLKTIAGLRRPTAGSILLDGKQIDRPDRSRGLVFQQYCVFPWLTVRENIELGSRCGTDTRESAVQQEVSSLLEKTGLTSYHDYYPSQLSGGMQQRVAIARTLAADPSLLLLDEPFGSLDAITRLDMQDLVRSVFATIRQGILLVTHDIREAVALSDRIALLGGDPASLLRTWSVPSARNSSSPMELVPEQENLARRIFATLSGRN